MKLYVSLILVFIGCASYSQQEWEINVGKVAEYTGVVVANGRIGILPEDKPFKSRSIILNNVYDKESPLGVSKILSGMNFALLELEIDGIKITKENVTGWSQTLNMKEATLISRFRFQEKAEITFTLYALRNVPYSGYLDVSIKALKAIELKATGFIETPEEYLNPESSFRVHKDLETTMPILQTTASSRMGRHKVATSATFIWHHINSTRENQRPQLLHKSFSKYRQGLSFNYSIPSNETLNFAWTGAECTTQDFSDPQSESERFVIFNLLTPQEDLLNEHKKQWQQLWEGDIEIKGNLQDQLDVRLALYHLYSFARADSDLSIAPMGLSSQNYNGHIFWDTELWMYPPLLLLNQDIALSLINYRSNRLDKAQQKAVNFGYQGAMFPWESDDTGEEATPTWALTGTFEHHITADVGIAFWNYYRITKNEKWLREKGFPMLKEIADFWVSRVTPNADGSYSIKNVVGANEFAPNVDDNAFTNGSAITCLDYATRAAKVVGSPADPNWMKVAKGIRILNMADGTTKEHSRYDGAIIKQADVNLLSYPLDVIQDKAQITKDLEYYEPRVSEEGPAMAQAIFSILYARLGNRDKAYELFKRSFVPNKRPPFGALAEAATSNNPYFVTGAGGLLQAILFGFGGLHLTDDGIIQKNPLLPKEWESLKIKGVGKEKKTFEVKK